MFLFFPFLNREGGKNSIGKLAGRSPAHVSTGTAGRISGNYTGLRPVCVITQNQEPIRPVVPVLTFAGDQPALFPPLLFAPSLFKPSESSGINQSSL